MWRVQQVAFQEAYHQLKSALELSRQRSLSPLEQQGLIQAFEFTHEMAWKLMREFAKSTGRPTAATMRQAVDEGHSLGLISERATWDQMRSDRNASVHSYDCDLAESIAVRIAGPHATALHSFDEVMRCK